ncbi:unnamed protein product [Caenorhabditis bovis]|uniref:Uncharacterized protein n=1 Tax=Caenorhabditis bovis TaxID=2654633 RepID=A0A8S1EIC6_9PELO|nr:unnamed protein product [Caenorhabditis bovis]
MEKNSEPSANGETPGKSIMNFLKRALSFRRRTHSDVASTSDDCFPLVAPSVYEDPFVAVTADGFLHIKYYMVFNPKAEFHMNPIHTPLVRQYARSVEISQIEIIFYASGHESQDEQVCKTWGISRNDVWWASHLNRNEKGNLFTKVVIDEGLTMRTGFSVVNMEALAEVLQCLGLPTDTPFQHGIPSPPFKVLQIPFIDDNVDDLDKDKATSS